MNIGNCITLQYILIFVKCVWSPYLKLYEKETALITKSNHPQEALQTFQSIIWKNKATTYNHRSSPQAMRGTAHKGHETHIFKLKPLDQDYVQYSHTIYNRIRVYSCIYSMSTSYYNNIYKPVLKYWSAHITNDMKQNFSCLSLLTKIKCNILTQFFNTKRMYIYM